MDHHGIFFICLLLVAGDVGGRGRRPGGGGVRDLITKMDEIFSLHLLACQIILS